MHSVFFQLHLPILLPPLPGMRSIYKTMFYMFGKLAPGRLFNHYSHMVRDYLSPMHKNLSLSLSLSLSL